MLIFDTEEYIDSLISVLQEGWEVPLLVFGHSMEPFLIHERDTVLLSPVDRMLKKGDIALFKRKDGQYILHRIYKIKDNDFYFVGDNQNLCDVEAKRHGTEIYENDFIWRFFKKGWLWTIRWRPYMKKLLALVSHK